MTAPKRPKLKLPSGSVSERIETALRKLPSKWDDGKLPKMTHVLPIKDMAEKYEYLIVPDMPEPAKGETATQLKHISETAETLLYDIMSLQGPAIDALKHFQDLPALNPAVFDGPRKPTLPEFHALRAAAKRSAEFDPLPGLWHRLTLAELGRALDRLSATADAALKAVEESGPDQRKPRVQPMALAKAAALDFYDLTGDRPERNKARDNYIDLLKEIFETLNVYANVDYYARQVIENWESIMEERETSKLRFLHSLSLPRNE